MSRTVVLLFMKIPLLYAYTNPAGKHEYTSLHKSHVATSFS